MKKIYILTAVLALLTLSLNAQTMATKYGGSHKAPNRATVTGSVTVADGTSTSTGYQYMPVYGYYFERAQSNQMIYTATQLGLQVGDVITSLTYYPRDAINFSGGSVTLSLGNTSTSQFSSAAPLSGVSLTQVAQTTSYTMSNGGWTINFSTPFTYSGENLLVQFSNASGTYGRTYFYGQDQTNNQSYCSYNNTLYTFLPKITLGYERSDNPLITANPSAITLSSNPNTSANQTVSVSGVNLTDGITATLSDANGVFSLSTTSLGNSGGNLTVTYLPTAVGTHTATITFTSSGADPVTISLTGNCTLTATICDGTGTNKFLPIYGYYYDTKQINQVIYPESMLTSLVGKKITSMTFYSPNIYCSEGAYNVQFGTTNQASFSSAARITTGLTTIATGLEITSGTTELTITFSEPFEYNGGNLLMDFEVTTVGEYGGYGNDTYFYGETHSGGGFYSYGSSINSTTGVYSTASAVQDFLPKVTFTYVDAAPRHDLAIALSAPASVVEGNDVTVTATVTNTGNQTESGYTVTFSDGTTTFSTQTGGTLAAGATQTFTATYTTTNAQGGTTVNFSASVACTDDADATNNSATASTQVTILPPPENVAATPGNNMSATVTWDLPIIATVPATLTWDFEEQSDFNDFTTIDADGDGYNWAWHQNTGSSNLTTNSGDGIVYSESYHKLTSGGTVLYPDNWLISPEVTLGGTLEFYACGQDPNQYWNEVFGVYVCVGSYNGVTDFVQVGADVTTTHDMTKYTYNLSQYQGQGYFAIVHHNVSDEFYLNVDDITYTYGVGNYPISYNVYLDDQLVNNVSGSTFSYDFSNLAEGQHQCAVSAVYAEGESAQVPASFTIAPPVPTLIAPAAGTTINVGTNEGSGASTTVNVSGSNLTEALTVSFTGEGFSVSPTSISAADANAGTTITITYNGTNPNATGTLTISSNEVSVTVDLTASYVYHAPELITPVNESTVDVGTNYGRGVSKTINISGNYLTQDLTVSVSGRGFSIDRDVTITAAEANAGKDITVTYNGVKPNATGTLTISSSEVSATVHLTASYATSGSITVFDGEYSAGALPVYGLFYDEPEHNQMVYPARVLSAIEGKSITSMTFYPTSGWYDNDNDNVVDDGEVFSGINFSGGSVTFKLMNLSSGTSPYADENPTLITGTMTPVATVTPTANTSATTWVITFDQPFEYTGGDLLIDVTTSAGTYSPSYFVVDAAGSNLGAMNCSFDGTNYNYGLDYLPKVTFTFEGEEELPTYSTDGIIRMGNLIIVDQFWASTAENTHPEQYSYILRYTPAQGDPKESSPKTVDVEHVKSVVNGYYTEQDVKNDSITYNTVIVNKMTADVEMTLPNNDNKIYYVRLQGKDNDVPSEADKVNDNSDMIVKLQMTSGDGGFYYIDQIPTSHPQYTPGQVNHFMDPAEPSTGSSYGDFKTYVPSVMTYGQSRRYFANDTLHNTYGAPVWRTGIGDVTIQNGMKVERQSNQWGTTQWEANGQACSLYILDNILAYGKLPNKQNSNVDYEPYMFRVFVESPSSKLRGYTPQNVYSPEKPDSIIGTELVADNSFTNFTGPICIYSEYFDGASHIDTVADATNGDYFKFTLNKNSDNWVDNAMFGGLDDIIQGEGDDLSLSDNDLKVYVRFYYRSKGSMNPSHVIRGRDGSLPHMYYGAEAESPTPDPWTSVTEVRSHGEIIGVTYVNAQGMTSNKPFDGLNIVVTRYSDGSTTTTKVVR